MKFLALFVALLGICDGFDKGVLPPQETQCYFFVGCDSFPQNKICALAVDGCYAPYTFGNDCELDVYNCEHPSNQFYKYWDGSCYPEDDMITIPPIERESVTVRPEELITISPIERESATVRPKESITISPIERESATVRPEELITISPIERESATVRPKESITISPIERESATVRPKESITISPIERESATVRPIESEPATVRPIESEPATVRPIESEPATISPKPITRRPKEIFFTVRPIEV